MSTDELKGDTLFFLSLVEAESDYIKNDRVAKLSSSSGEAAYWRLRSSGNSTYNVASVQFDGTVNTHGSSVTNNSNSTRPAFNLDSSKILFTSAAKGGEASNAADGELSKNADYTISGDEKYEYKLTMLDTSRDFEVAKTTASGTKGETIALNYENAEIGSNEYISAMIVDKTTNEVLYYGQLANAAEASSGTVEFKIPTDIALGNHKVMLFNEQINGDYKTDFSSDFVAFDLTVTLKGEGAATKPYLIYNLSDLKDFRDAVNSGTSYAGQYIKLMNNIDMSAEYVEGKQSWTPIGRSSGKAFNETFDGNKFEIRNLYINTQDENNLGLFGCIGSSAVIKTLGVTGSVNAKTTTCVGGLAG